jgi:hypothetical protein
MLGVALVALSVVVIALSMERAREVGGGDAR